jgi:hypothetical protein
VISTTRGLLVLAVVALLLGIAVLVAPAHRTSTDRSLAPHVALEDVDTITVTHVGAPPVLLVRRSDGWHWKSDNVIAESSTVDAILSTLRGAHWHRRAAASVAQPVTAELRLDGSKPLSLSRGRDVVGAAQTWIVRGNDALLVDSWVAAALFPAPLALRVAHPLANASQASGIIVGELHVVGTHLRAPKDLWLDPSVVARLVTALANIEIVALAPDAPGPAGDHGEVFEMDGPQRERVTTVERIGVCDGGRVLVGATTGGGCVEGAAWQAVVDALAPIRELAAEAPSMQAMALADRRPLPIEPAQITFGDGTVLSLASPPRIGDSDADRQRVEALVAALTAPGTTVARPTGAPRTTITARDAAGTEVVLELFDKAIARRGEPVAIALEPGVLAVIARPPSALRDQVRWREDATTLSSMTVNGVTYTRGAVLGEWTRTPAGTVDAALVDALASALAIVRAPDEAAAGPWPLSIRVTFTPPAGKPSTHELLLGAPAQDGCTARIDGAPVRASLELCTAAHVLAH